MKVVLGAADTHYPGWVSTNENTLNLLQADDWRKFMPVEMALAEHVWEHLTPGEGQLAALNCHTFVPRMRVAVPDGLFPDSFYQARARLGECEGDHLNLFTYKTLREMFTAVGYTVQLLEWWDETGVFHYRPWSPVQGMIMRSLRFDSRNKGQIGYTSIILDAFKGGNLWTGS